MSIFDDDNDDVFSISSTNDQSISVGSRSQFDPLHDLTPSSFVPRSDVIIPVRFACVSGSISVVQGDTLTTHCYRRDLELSACVAQPVEYWMQAVVVNPRAYWCWRVHFDGDGVVIDFREVSPFEPLCCGDTETGTLVFERKCERSMAWSAHTWNSERICLLLNTGEWIKFKLTSPDETARELQNRLNMQGMAMMRVTCPLLITDKKMKSNWATPMYVTEEVFKGSAALTGYFVFLGADVNLRMVGDEVTTKRECTNMAFCPCGECIECLVCRESM